MLLVQEIGGCPAYYHGDNEQEQRTFCYGLASSRLRRRAENARPFWERSGEFGEYVPWQLAFVPGGVVAWFSVE